MEKNVAKKKKSTFGKVCSIIVDILVIPVIVLAFICTILTFSAKANNQVPQIFGKSIVTVLTESMEPEYKVGDVLIINKVNNLDTLKIGDNIAFYAPIWLGSPFTTTLDNGEKVSNVIYHQIVDIIYPKDGQGNPVRHFVCRGTNLSAPEYTYVGEGNGNYKKEIVGETEKYVISQGTGDYDIVLENMPPQTNGDNITTGNVGNSSMSTMQYITDEYVVGVYNSSLSPALGGFIKFSSSSLGLLCMVVIPAALMTVFVIFGLIKEVKESKEEEEEDQLVLEGNMSALKETSLKAKQEAEAESAKEKQVALDAKTEEAEIDIQSVIGGVVGAKSETSAKEENSKQTKLQSGEAAAEKVNTAKVVASKPTKSVTTKTTTKTQSATKADVESAKQTSKPVTKTLVKTAPKSTEAKVEAKSETKAVASKPATAKPVATTPKVLASAAKAEVAKPATKVKTAPSAAKPPVKKAPAKKDN